MPATILSIDLIISDPQIRNGRPVIRGTTLRVSDLVTAKLFHNRTPDELAADYALSLAQVYAALAYYYDHKEEIDADIRQQLAFAKEAKEKGLGQRHPPLLG